MLAAVKADSPVDRVLARLTKVKATGRRAWLARCPAHDDRTPSLSVGEGRDGRVLLTCHAGCAYPAIVAAMGVESSELAPSSSAVDRRHVEPITFSRPTLQQTYDYVNEDSDLLFQVCRYVDVDGSKDFKQRRPTGAGEWISSRGDARLVPYRLPELIEAIALDREVYVVEGEKDVETLSDLGLTATTNAGGAGKWLDEYSAFFAGASVVVIPDNDNAGRDHARRVAESITAAGGHVRVAMLPGLPPKGDVTDWMATHTRAELVDALEACTNLTIERAEDVATAAAMPLRFRLYTAAELDEIPDPEPLVQGVLDRATLAMMYAKFASYKSFVALDVALHVAHGLDWHGHAVSPGVVVFIYAEGRSRLRRRVQAWRQFNGLPEVSGIHFLPQSVLLNDPRDLGDLQRAIAALGVPLALIVVDTVARTFKGNENAAEDMGAYIIACDRLKETTGATVLLVHHPGWEGTRSRGSNSLPGALDTELSLTRDGDRVTVAATKQKDGAEGEIVTLQAVPLAGSLAFKRFGPNSPELSSNERRALESVQSTDGLKTKTWERDSALAHGSFYNARTRLLDLGYVRYEKRTNLATEAGRLALGPTVQASPNAVQTPPVSVSPTLPLSIRQGSGLDDDLDHDQTADDVA